ncbi:helix-turn-helix domain-containing protein [Bosea sp. FBZP-16]|uniref:helix-turn-helix domain-containing protein n=1 Tax=Bosea sp. FBZP-16 TaxID=2065382 RepID=UPI0020BFEDB5|nr:helix-turn-helix domain-containing protein [Bosea sp. FBZP-16]
MTQIDNETLARTVAAYKANDCSQRATALTLGLARSTVQNQLKRAAERGMLGTEPVLPGYRISQVTTTPHGDFVQQKPERGDAFEVPAGHSVKGISALLDEDGREIIKWVKTRNEYAPADIADILKTAFLDYRATEPIPAPAASDLDLLTLVPCNDWHVNLLTWERETGQNWDLAISERVIGQGIDDAIARSPAAGTAVVLAGGDLLHADDNESRTKRSNNVLDTDGRHQKGLETAGRLMVRTIDAALRKNRRVVVRVLKGNHDEHTSVAIGYFLLAWYRDEPRVTVDVDASLFWWFRHGSVLLGATHGHTVKLKDMASIMAHRRAEDWGATKFRYVHGFHIHHASKFQTEGGGVIMESHQAPIPQDAWHFGAGFLSGRSVQTITYHASYGEISRVRVAILDAANDNNEQGRAVA